MKPILPPAPGKRSAQRRARGDQERPPGEVRALPQLSVAGSAAPHTILLACGNPLRQDDGVGLRIAEAAEQLLPASHLRIVAAQQWTPELAMELAEAELAIFVDACVDDEPGAIRVRALRSSGAAGTRRTPAAEDRVSATHGLEPEGLLALAETLCGHKPARAFALTVGAGSLGYGETMTGLLRQAVPRAVRLVGNLVAAFDSQAVSAGGLGCILFARQIPGLPG